MRLIDVLTFPRSLLSIIMYKSTSSRKEIEMDLKKMNLGNSIFSLHLALKNHTFRNIFFYRTNKTNPILTKFCKLFYKPLFSLEISSSQIEGGMLVYHGYSTIVFASKIGSNFTVYQNVTIGRGKMVNGIDIPRIGDNVTVYAGANVIGEIVIGDNVKVGAGAVVTKDVPDNCTVVGYNKLIYKETNHE